MFTKNCGTRPLERSWSVRGNAVDAYAVAVIKDGTIVSHLPRRISRLCTLFIRRGGVIQCQVTGRRKYSSDLASVVILVDLIIRP